jgi:hypothetical protein
LFRDKIIRNTDKSRLKQKHVRKQKPHAFKEKSSGPIITVKTSELEEPSEKREMDLK